jgi:hypothetical protein
MRLVQDRIGFPAGCKCAFVIGVALQQVAVEAIQTVLRDLRPTGVVEKDGWAIERRELLSNEGKVERHGFS